MTALALDMQWTIIDGQAYDCTEFVHRHPGGAELLRLAFGRDSSILFHSYHRRFTKVQAVLSTLPKIGKNEIVMPSPVFGHKGLTAEDAAKLALPAGVSPTLMSELESPLYKELRAEVNAYFKSADTDGMSSASRGGMIMKSAALVLSVAFLYWLAVFRGYWLLTPFIGLLFAMLGLSIQHDASHGAFSSNYTVNIIAGFCCDVIGSSALMWRHQHVLSHHCYPNDDEWDVDTFSHYPAVRINPAQKRYWFHAYQHFYMPIMYSLMMIDYQVSDAVSYFTGKYNHLPVQAMRWQDHFSFWFGKAIHWTFLLGIPLIMNDWRTAVFRIAMPLGITGGFFLALLFVIGHNTSDLEHNLPKGYPASTKADGHVPCWAELQIRASANFAPKSTFWLMVSGGLNFQIEHHLFPAVAHIHYPAIGQIVKRACAKRDIPYTEYDSFTEVVMNHIMHLRQMGNEDVPQTAITKKNTKKLR